MSQPSCSTGRAALTDLPSVLFKAFAILEVFGRKERRVRTLSQLAHHSGLPKSTVHRVIGMLLAVGAVEREGDAYRIGGRLFALSTRSLEGVLVRASLPHTSRLHEETGLPVLLSRRYGDAVGYLDLAPCPDQFPSLAAGDLRPIHETAEGRTLLAFSGEEDVDAVVARWRPAPPPEEVTEFRRQLRYIRTRSLALDEPCVLDGHACAVAPVVVGGQAVLAVSIAYRPAEHRGRQLVPPLRSAVAAITDLLEPMAPLAAPVS